MMILSNIKNRLLRMLLSALLSVCKPWGGPLLAIKNKVDTVVETVECVAEVVELVAEEVEMVADEVVDSLPEGTMLKETVCSIEAIAKETAEDARKVEEFIQKVEDMEEEVIESLIKPFIDQVEKVVEGAIEAE
ncbi:hypothetical protein COLO4_27301 [Corchorus olitorius]|uniref:Uncharacterized protein n=1 Tax=Corchorus olitorius TaxID=93759 RepID=A0A1R3HRP6_9ROSI|nr:hypothetical protein COLO4_27301 [Corchorus olitorius]